VSEFHLPPPSLEPFIEGYWHRSGHFAQEKKVRVVADACTDIILEFAPTPWPPRYVIGTQLAPIVVTLRGDVDRSAIRFRPGMAWFFLRRPLDGLTDRVVPMTELEWQVPGTLYERLAAMERSIDRSEALSAWLTDELDRLKPDPEEVGESERLASALSAGTPPHDLPTLMGRNSRRLQRVCRERFGATAIHLHRLYRFRRLYERLQGGGESLADLAVELGYSDQAHMAREFRHFAGTSITAFLAERGHVGNLQDEGKTWLPILAPD
jgi:AraC-like DNA-binding protein